MLDQNKALRNDQGKLGYLISKKIEFINEKMKKINSDSLKLCFNSNKYSCTGRR
jgi:hypothetical protein